MNCIIFANGDFSLLPDADAPWQHAELIIATDGGARYCHLLQLTPHLLIGDMDSIPPWLLEHLTEHGSEVHRFPCRKDKTDLELAIDLAVERGAQDILIFGALGGRWDMSIAAIMLLTAPAYTGIPLTLRDCSTDICRVHAGEHVFIDGNPGDTLSLIPLTGPVRGVTLTGLDYPLTDQDIFLASTRGISNVLCQNRAGIALREGVLLIIHSKQDEQPK